MTEQAKNTQRSVTIYVRGNTVGDLEQKAYSKARLYFQDESVHLEIEAFRATSLPGHDEKYQADITVIEALKAHQPSQISAGPRPMESASSACKTRP